MAPIYPSYAKVNLHLQVVGRRADGYHELRTLFQTIDLHDRVGVELVDGEAVRLSVLSGEVPEGEDNLAVRAARAFLGRWAPGQGVEMTLEKRIPVGGGLGGGSSNAATVLLALRRQLGRPDSVADLWQVARELGADVPYFLWGGTALGVGRGDEIILLPDLQEVDLTLVVPPVHVSTPAIFGKLRNLTAEPMARTIVALATGRGERDPADIEAWNDLQPVAFDAFPALRRAYDEMLAAGAREARLSGTGAALFALLPRPLDLRRLRRGLTDGTAVVRCRTQSRESLARDGAGLWSESWS